MVINLLIGESTRKTQPQIYIVGVEYFTLLKHLTRPFTLKNIIFYTRHLRI